ncbi:MAG: hypothetical protein HW387_1435 [Parachlamydiales bacterium]|nr:hypothetical protein [Parachlamydiales bacterium]
MLHLTFKDLCPTLQQEGLYRISLDAGLRYVIAGQSFAKPPALWSAKRRSSWKSVDLRMVTCYSFGVIFTDPLLSEKAAQKEE